MSRYSCVLTFCVIAAAGLCPCTIAPKAYGLAESVGPDGSNAQAVHDLGYLGQDVNVGLISAKNTRTTHEAFKDTNGISHAFYHDFTGEGLYEPDNHDTWVAGVVASRGGVSYPNDIGVAPGVDIHSAKITRKKSPSDPNRVIDFSWLADALDDLINDYNCQVIVTGIALEDEPNNGQSDWTMLYDYYAYEHNVVFANASGKNHTHPTVFGDGYNGITTGGLVVTDPNVYLRVGSNSNIGPTDDGRRKPDLAAPSQNQTMPGGGSDNSWNTWTTADGATSLSTPHTAGLAALLLGLANDTAEPNDGHNEVIKAAIVNSTFPNINDKNNNSTNPADPNNVWHPHRGYGRIDALRAYELLNTNQVTRDVNITQPKGWAFDTIAGQLEHTYTIYAQRHWRLVATLTWDRRIEWNDAFPYGKINSGELSPYLADLDLRVYEPNDANAIYTGLFSDDNLEKCDLLLTTTGDYLIKVINNSASESPDYGLAFELLPPIPGDFDPIDYIVDYVDLARLTQEWLLVGPDLEADLVSDDNTVDMKDFAAFANHWLEIEPAYYQQP